MGFFYLHSITLTCYFRCHRAGSQLKILEDVIRNEIGDSVIRKMFFWVTENVFQCKTTDCNITYSRFETLSYLKVNIPNEITDDEYKKLNDTELIYLTMKGLWKHAMRTTLKLTHHEMKSLNAKFVKKRVLLLLCV